MLVLLGVWGWQVYGFAAVSRGDFLDDSKLGLRVSSTKETGMGLEQVAGLHLFGEITAVVAEPPPPTDLPKTDLKLVLVGAMTDSDPQKASALISADNQTRRFYVGDSIPGGAVLHEVLADSVVLKRDARYETLFFPKASSDAVAAPTGTGRAGVGSLLGKPRAVAPPPTPNTPASSDKGGAMQQGAKLRERLLQHGPRMGRPTPDAQ
jgi:type II secretory pathway component PulC